MSGLFISATGILNAIRRQDVTANNIANLVTPGFRGARGDSVELSGGGVGFGSVLRDFGAGPAFYTGRGTDLHSARGFFQVSLPDGSRGFTLAGNFGLNAEGQVVTSDGARLEPPIQVPEGAGNITIGQNGVVFASGRDGSAPESVGRLQVFEFANPNGLESAGGNVFVTTAASGEPLPVTAPRFETGILAGSNVDLAAEAVNSITNRNAFQANVSLLRAQGELLGELLDLEE